MTKFIVSGNGRINLFLDKQYVVPTDHPNYAKIKAGLNSLSESVLKRLVDIPRAVNKFLNGKAEIVNGLVYFNGQELHNTMTNRILTQMREGFPVGPMLKFLENLMQNPSMASVEELYDFLSNEGLPITEDGCFLAYKGIRSDYMDKYSGTIDNHPGCKPEMPRNKVDDNRSNTCSKGLHVGALEYARSYCNEIIVLVKVNPKDVVSVPLDANAQKCRVERYEVLSVYEEVDPIRSQVWGIDPDLDADDWDDDEDCCDDYCDDTSDDWDDDDKDYPYYN